MFGNLAGLVSFDMMSCLYTIRNDDFYYSRLGGGRPAGFFLWLLLEGERGEVGVLFLGIEAGAVFLHPRKVAVAEDLRAGVIVLQAPEKVEQGVLLGWRPGVVGLTVGIETAFVTDADGVGVIALGMDPGYIFGTGLVELAVLGDVVMVADTRPAL